MANNFMPRRAAAGGPGAIGSPSITISSPGAQDIDGTLVETG